MKRQIIIRIFLNCLILFVGLTNPKANDKVASNKSVFRFSKNYDPIDNFWSWFRENEHRLRNFETNPNKYLNEVLTEAKKIKSGLAIEFEPPKNGIINMTISADGNIELFPIVQSIVHKAPKVKGWNIIAFRQRLPLDQIKTMRLKVEDRELDPGQMKFFPVISGDTIDIIIYVKGVTPENYKQTAYGGFLLLDNILGEYDCVTKVRSYDFHDMPTTEEELKDLFPLLGLAYYIDKFYASKKQP
jgi:hypothetical protein